jgi:flagellar basal-body rod modification protein FlgD
MIPPSLAASAVTSAVSLLTSAASAASSPAPAADATGAAKTAAKKNDVVNQADFMQLLIAQLQNQDPLNPLDSANFSAQLAQFSSLQQLTEINQHLADQGSGGTGPARFDAVGFLGKQVVGKSSAITVTQGTATGLDYTLAAGSNVEARIVDSGGHTVASLVLGPQAAGAHHFDPGSVAGAPTLPDGTYTVQLTVPPSGTSTDPTPVETTVGGAVTGIDLSGDTPVLLIGESRLALTDVRQVKEPQAS